jgi:hypothetical protein
MYRLTLAVVRGLGVEDCFDAIFGGDSAAENPSGAFACRPAALSAVRRQRGDRRRRRHRYRSGKTRRGDDLRCHLRLGDKSELIAAAPDLLIDDLTELYDHFC